MSLLSEFKEFALRGSVVDLAIGVVIGAAFGKIVDSMVKDVVMPVIGTLLGGVDFRHLYVNLGDGTYASLEAAEKAGAPLVKYGVFINTVVEFVIIAFVIFLVIRAFNRMRREAPVEPAAPAPVAEDVVLLQEIRDELRRR